MESSVQDNPAAPPPCHFTLTALLNSVLRNQSSIQFVQHFLNFMPSLGDVAHNGCLSTFTIQQQLDIPSARSWAAPIRSTGTMQKRQAVRPIQGCHRNSLPKKILRRRLETVFVIPQKKMLHSWNYMYLGIANSKVWNKMQFGKKMRFDRTADKQSAR